MTEITPESVVTAPKRYPGHPYDLTPKEYPALGFELPERVRHIEGMILNKAWELLGDRTITSELFETSVRLITQGYEDDLDSYEAIGRLATNPNSLSYKQYHQAEIA